MYLVGGAVRDKLIGVKPKDLDYVVCVPDTKALVTYVESRGGVVKHFDTRFGRLRAQMPGSSAVHDYVMSRRDGTYTDSRHPDTVQAANLYEDLSRRDFTINAIAQNVETGEITDPFNGIEDLKRGLLRCVGNTTTRLTEDPLRMLRAIRFAVTKTLSLDDELHRFISQPKNIQLLGCLSTDRVVNELNICFRERAFLTIQILARYPDLCQYIFNLPNLKLKLVYSP